MISEFSDRSKDLQERLLKFMDDTVYPNEAVYQDQWTARRNVGASPRSWRR